MNWCLPKHVIASRQYWHLVTWNQKSIKTRMHSSRMRTIRCSGRLSCHVHPPATRPPPLCHVHPLLHAPPAMHALCHAHPLPCIPPPHSDESMVCFHKWFLCTPSLPCMPPSPHIFPFAMHTSFTTHTPLRHACRPSPYTHPPDRMTDACENITFPQLLLRTVKINTRNRHVIPTIV